MKIIKNIIWILSLFLVCSCGSDNLSNSKAEDIISECLEKEPIRRSVSIQFNNTKILKDEIYKYEKLQEDGYIKMTQKIVNAPKPQKKGSKNTNDPLAQWRQEAELRRYNRELELLSPIYQAKTLLNF